MNPTALSKEKLFGSLPQEWPRNLLPEIQHQVQSAKQKMVVLDDDPTGTQTVHGIPVLTHWSIKALADELNTRHPAFYILTNSRSMTVHEACRLNRQIGNNLNTASQKTGIAIEIISRSDSTLRGHFPDEVDALAQALGAEGCPFLLAPCFFEGGRYTIHDIHYVDENNTMIPAAETAYARDAVFGYGHSNLKQWVEEKTRGCISRNQVTSLSLEDIRQGGPDRVKKILGELPSGAACVVNAASYRDLEVVVQGLLAAEGQGFRPLLRAAASIVRVRCGMAPRPLLEPRELVTDNDSGGLFIVGSHVPKTTRQVEALISAGQVVVVKIDVSRLLDASKQAGEIKQASIAMNQAIGRGQDTVVYTSRDIVRGQDSAHSLQIGQRISDSLVLIIAALAHQPRYLVAKGGITASDVATAGLGIRRAMILGQVLPGVPVWELGDETRYPGMAYIVFPGNVGDDRSLAVIQKRLRA